MKKLALLMALLLFILPVTANAATPRYVNIRPGIDFNGTTATCTVSVTGNSMKDEIEIVVKLWNGGSCIATWKDSGTGYVNFSKDKTVIKNNEYKLTADVTINGEVQPKVSTTATCKQCEIRMCLMPFQKNCLRFGMIKEV